jgi:ankyrin repeat protein
MPDRTLPDHPNLQHYKKQAKQLARDCASGHRAALTRVLKHHPRLRNIAADQPYRLALVDAQLVLAREHNFTSWPKFAKHIETLRIIRSLEDVSDPVSAFLEVASVDIHGWHSSGTLEHAEMLLARYPKVASANIYTAAVLADEPTVRAFLARDSTLATSPGDPRRWDALTHLCFSRYLRLDKSRADAFTATARALLEAGARANTGWWDTIDDPPRRVPETAIYGAAAIAQHPGLTRVLLEYGADPNDEETPYHVAEGDDHTVLRILLKSGRFNARSLATLLVRKANWHDMEGLRLALEHGADPNFLTIWESTPLQASIRCDNSRAMVALLLEHGGDPALPNGRDGQSAIQMAVRRGRGDILDLFEQRGTALRLSPPDTLIAACGRGDGAAARPLADSDPDAVVQVLAVGGAVLSNFAGVGNLEGVRCLLDLGVAPGAVHGTADPYWDVTPETTALHQAAWRARHEVVRELIARGAPIHVLDSKLLRWRWKPAPMRTGSLSASLIPSLRCWLPAPQRRASISPLVMTPSMLYCCLRKSRFRVDAALCPGRSMQPRQ